MRSAPILPAIMVGLKHGLTLFGGKEVISEDIFTYLEEAISLIGCLDVAEFQLHYMRHADDA